MCEAVAKIALSNERAYKEIVTEIENHIRNADVDKRLAGIYVIDAIVRGVRNYNTIKSI